MIQKRVSPPTEQAEATSTCEQRSPRKTGSTACFPLADFSEANESFLGQNAASVLDAGTDSDDTVTLTDICVACAADPHAWFARMSAGGPYDKHDRSTWPTIDSEEVTELWLAKGAPAHLQPALKEILDRASVDPFAADPFSGRPLSIRPADDQAQAQAVFAQRHRQERD